MGDKIESRRRLRKKYLVLVTYLLENFEIQQNTIIFVLQKECDNM